MIIHNCPLKHHGCKFVALTPAYFCTNASNRVPKFGQITLCWNVLYPALRMNFDRLETWTFILLVTNTNKEPKGRLSYHLCVEWSRFTGCHIFMNCWAWACHLCFYVGLQFWAWSSFEWCIVVMLRLWSHKPIIKQFSSNCQPFKY